MTQLALGLDRDSSVVAKSFDERDEAVKALMSMAIKACKAQISMSASAARAPRIIRNSRAGWLNKASTACR